MRGYLIGQDLWASLHGVSRADVHCTPVVLSPEFGAEDNENLPQQDPEQMCSTIFVLAMHLLPKLMTCFMSFL